LPSGPAAIVSGSLPEPSEYSTIPVRSDRDSRDSHSGAFGRRLGDFLSVRRAPKTSAGRARSLRGVLTGRALA
jgi:hypothetical protein